MAEYHAIHLHHALKEGKQPQQNHLILCSCVSVVCDLFFFKLCRENISGIQCLQKNQMQDTV